MEISELLKNKRKEKGLSQKELAKLANVTNQTICAIENGKLPTYLIICRLAKALDCEELAELYDKTDKGKLCN